MADEQKLIIQALTDDRVNITLQAWFRLQTKVLEESVVARKEGNKLYGKGSHNAQIHEKIWKFYSESIAKAPLASEDLAAAYSNRSALLVHIRKYRESIIDIDRALLITQNNTLKVKLFCRKTECLTALGMSENESTLKKAKYWFGKVTNEKDKDLLGRLVNKVNDYMKQCNMITCEEKMSSNFSQKLSSSNSSSSSNNKSKLMIQKILAKKKQRDPFEMVSLKYSDTFGRHLIAKQDIKPGEIVMVVKPYVKSLNLNNFHAFCGHCLETCWTSIPCDYCNWCMFCSEECKIKAWEKYHDIECAVIPYIKFNQMSDYWKQLALRMTVIAIKEAGSIENLKKELKKIDSCKNKLQKGFIDGKFYSDTYQSIYSLSHNVSSDSLITHVNHAMLTLMTLAKSTSLFGESIKFKTGKDLLANEDAIFVGTVLLRFLKISDLNAHSVMEGYSPCRFSKSLKQCEIDRCCERGCCIAGVPSFMNHSCDPNIGKVFTEDMQLVIYSLQPIQQNSQLFDCYLGTYFDKPLQERQLLMKMFNFICCCRPCKEDWPVAEKLKILKQPSYRNRTAENINLEIMLMNKYKDLFDCMRDKRHFYNLTKVKELSADIEKASQCLTQPSYITATLICNLCRTINFNYSMKLCIPRECN